uniref:EF-hand domain-containing protein n=1 Tax=Chrysotila carterae TaxID=13221 RepID=A0A7S4BUH8_CHRCT
MLSLCPALPVAVEKIIAEHPWAGLLTPTQFLEIKTAFYKFDSDYDGHIDASELMSVMRSCGLLPTPENVIELLDSVDIDHNGVIEFREFVLIMARRILQDDGKVELLEAFKLLDNDANGYVDIEEARRLFMTAGTQVWSNAQRAGYRNS